MILLDNTVTAGGAVKIEVFNALNLLGYDVCIFGEKLVGEYYIPYRPDFSVSRVSLCFETIFTMEYRGFNLWDLCKGSIAYEHPVFFQEYTQSNIDQVEKIYSRAIACIDVCTDIYQKKRPSGVVVWGGMLIESRILSALAKRHNVPVFAIEFSFDKGKIHFDAAGRIGNEFSIVADWPRLNSKKQLTHRERQLIDDWVANNYSGKVSNQPKGELSSNTTYFLSSCKKTPLLLLAQCFIDTVVTYDNLHFENSIEAYRNVIDACINLNQPVIVKTHPGDRPEYKKQLKELCLNRNSVLFVSDENNENVYRLMDACSAGIVINSQSGLEMAAKGKRIFMLGNSFYGELPHCTALTGPHNVQTELSQFLSLPPLESWEVEIGLQFLHYLLFELLVDVSKSSLHTARQICARLENIPFHVAKRHPEITPSSPAKSENFTQLKIVITHPSPSWAGSGFYLQDLSAELVKLGHKVLILAEGTCAPYDEGVRWMQLSFQGQLLSQSVKNAVNELQPNVLVEVGVRTKPIRAALEIILTHNPLIIVQGEDDEFQPFSKYYPEPDPHLMDVLDKPFFFENDIADFVQSINIQNFVRTFSNPSAYRWVEPSLRSLMYHSADRYCAIWQPMKERLEGKFHKSCDLLPPVVRMENFDLTPLSDDARKKILTTLELPEDSIVYFINGNIYHYSEEYDLFVRSMIELQKYSDTPIALIACGNKGQSNIEHKIKHYRALGRLGDREYNNIIKISDVICAPGTPDTFNRYRLSSRLLKAMIFSKPIFTFKVGFAETLEDNKEGFFTHTDEPDEWLRVLKKTLSPTLRKKVGENSFSLIDKYFLASNVAKELELRWKEALVAKAKKLLPNHSGLITADVAQSNYNKIYNTHVPIQQRVLGGVKLNFSRYGTFTKFGRFSILGFGVNKVLGKVKCFHYCSGFSIPVERNSTKITLKLKYEPGNVDEKRAFFIYDAEGILDLKISRQEQILIIDFNSHYSDFIVFKPHYIKTSTGQKYFYQMLEIEASEVVGENYKADLARESIHNYQKGRWRTYLRKFDWRRSYICPLATPVIRKIGGEEAAIAYQADPVVFFRNLKNPYYRAIGVFLHPEK